MTDVFFHDLKERFKTVNNKLGEFFDIQKERESRVKEIEDETNRVLDEEKEHRAFLADDYLEKYAKALDASMEYAGQLINNIYNSQLMLDPKVPNAAGFQTKGRQNAAKSPVQYNPAYTENVRLLEQMNEQISRKISVCTRSEGSLLGFGKKLAGFNDSLYTEIYTLIFQAYNFYDGMQGYFERLIAEEERKIGNDQREYYNQTCADADNRVAEIDRICDEKGRQWVVGFERFLDEILPLHYFEQAEEIYDAAVKGMTQMTEKNARKYIPLGKLYLGIAEKNVPDWSRIEELFIRKYEKYIHSGYLWCYAVWNCEENRSLILTDYGKEGNREACREEMESILCKNILSEPAGAFLFTMCSASGLVEEYKGLSRFLVRFPDISGGKIITDKQEIREILDQYTAVMDEIIQGKLIGYTDIGEFNRKNPNQKIPRRCLCITGFPAGFDEQMLEKVSRLMKQGYKAGVQTIVQYDDRYYREGRTEEWMKSIMYTDHQYTWAGYTWQNAMYNRIYLWMLKTDFEREGYNLVDEFARCYDKERSKTLEITEVMETQKRYLGYSGDILRIPIGINETGAVQYLEMGDPVANGTSHYAVIAGPTGSGKSTLLHTIIMDALLSYPPEELELYLMDFKAGNEFKIYEGRNIPHIRCLALDAMQDFGESILERLWEILEERNNKFMEASRAGTEIKNISDYRKAGYQMPRILVLIDEFQVLFDRDQNKKTADRCAAKMSDFISRGRVYGIHFVFATQTMHKIFEGGSSISKSTLEEMHIRIGLQCQPKEMELLFGTLNYNACMNKRSDRKGSAVYLENDIVSKPVGMQVAYIESEKQRELLSEIETRFQNQLHDKTIVFRGSSEPEFSLDLMRQKEDYQTAVYLGEPIRIAEEVKIVLGKKRRVNVLVVGENQEMLDRIGKLWIYQAAAVHKDEKVYLIDGAEIVGEPSIIKANNFPSVIMIDNIFRVVPSVNEIYDIYTKRKDHMIKGIKDPEDEKRVHLVISNYQWIEPMIRMMERKSVAEFEADETEETGENALDGLMSILKEDDRPKSRLNPSQKLYTLLENGYLCGINIVLTCSEYGLLKKLTSSELLPFTNRILLKTAASSWYTLVESDINMKSLRDNTVLYSDGIHQPFLFKPYSIEN